MVRTDLQPQTFAAWSVPQVRRALDAHERGEFFESGLLADAIMRDDRIFATLDTRVLAVLGLPFKVNAGIDEDEFAITLASQVSKWLFHAIPEAVWADILRNQNRMGFAVGELTWSRHASGEMRPKLHVHHSQFVTWSHYTGLFSLQTTAGLIPITPGDGRWVLFAPNGQQQPWMNGTIRALSIPYMIRTFARRDWARRSEVEGIGVRKARIPAQGDPKIVDKFLRDVKALGAESTIRLPEGFDFSIEAPAATAADGFSKLVSHCDMAITLAILGQNLTTEVTGGSFAAATVHAKVQLDRLEADVAMLSTTIRDQILVPWGRMNFEDFDEDATPWPKWDTNPPEDIQRDAQALLTLSQAIGGLLTQGVDVAPVFEKFGLKLGQSSSAASLPPIFNYHITTGVVTPNEVRERLGLPPIEGGDKLVITNVQSGISNQDPSEQGSAVD